MRKLVVTFAVFLIFSGTVAAAEKAAPIGTLKDIASNGHIWRYAYKPKQGKFALDERISTGTLSSISANISTVLPDSVSV